MNQGLVSMTLQEGMTSSLSTAPRPHLPVQAWCSPKWPRPLISSPAGPSFALQLLYLFPPFASPSARALSTPSRASVSHL